MKVLQGVDAAQKKTKPAGIAVATFKKFSEDQSTGLAAQIAFWGSDHKSAKSTGKR